MHTHSQVLNVSETQMSYTHCIVPERTKHEVMTGC